MEVCLPLFPLELIYALEDDVQLLSKVRMVIRAIHTSFIHPIRHFAFKEEMITCFLLIST